VAEEEAPRLEFGDLEHGRPFGVVLVGGRGLGGTTE